MIKPIDSFANRFTTSSAASSYVHVTQLTAAKPRCGLQSIGDLIPRLIRQYEIQAEMKEKFKQQRQSPQPQTVVRSDRTKSRKAAATTRQTSRSVANSSRATSPRDSAKKQATFAWYD